MKKRDKVIWIIGSKGMLGTELSLVLEKSGLPFADSDREVDIADPAALSEFAEKQARPVGWIVNCAAYTAVDKAEDDTELCNKLNAVGPKNIAEIAKSINAKLIHISTDYVFDGTAEQPYKEDDPTNPIGVYGFTKRDGELMVLEKNPESYIIRTAWLYGKYGNNFVNTMLRLMNEKQEIKVVDDQRGSPTEVSALVAVILNIITKSSAMNIPYGIYHFTNEGDTTWFGFAKEIYRLGREMGLIKTDCNILPCTSSEFPAKVKRPNYSVLDKSKIKNAFEGLNIGSWEEYLKDYLEEKGNE